MCAHAVTSGGSLRMLHLHIRTRYPRRECGDPRTLALFAVAMRTLQPVWGASSPYASRCYDTSILTTVDKLESPHNVK